MNPYEQNPLAEGAMNATDPYEMMWRPPCMPYISAYAIAVKHGFQGSEKEWIESLNNNVMVVKATDLYAGENDAGTFRTTTTLEEIAEASAKGKIVVLDAYGSIAWMSQLTSGYARFAGANYRTGDLDCYTEFFIEADGQTAYQTYVMRSGGYELPADGIPAEDLSKEVLELLRIQTAYGFASFEEYESYNTQNPDAIKHGDLIWIGNNSQKTMFQKAATFLKPLVVIDAKDAEDGGYYTVNVRQTGEAVMEISFTPSKSGMPAVDAQTITLPKAREGEDGTDAVIWYTNVGPSGDIFLLQSLSGPTDASPAPGNMIVSNYTGMAYFITATDGAAVTVSSYKVQVTGSKGDTGPQGPGAELFKVTFSHTSGGYTADKTNAQIREAANDGKVVVGIDPLGRMMQLYRYGSTLAWFTALGYDSEDEEFSMQLYRIENDTVAATFDYLPNEAQMVRNVINALPVYGGETQ